jgi:hypothetical protein
MIGQEVERGELPNDEALLGTMIRNIYYSIARQYVALPEPPADGPRAKPAAGDGEVTSFLSSCTPFLFS